MNLFPISAIIAAYLTHELGHIGMAAFMGVKVKRVGLNWTGLYIVREAGTVTQNLWVSISGVLMNLLAVIVALGHWGSLWMVKFAFINILMAVWNLIPFPCSDGKRIYQLLFGGK